MLTSLVPRRGGGGGESAWYTLFAHARNYSKSHMVELGTYLLTLLNAQVFTHNSSSCHGNSSSPITISRMVMLALYIRVAVWTR